MRDFNRTRAKNCLNNKEYKIKSWIIDPDPYWEDGSWCWKTNIPNDKRRSWRSWKYNRKTQYKL